MKKLILFVIVLSFVSCKPKVVYMDDSEFCYVDTEDGRLWGIYRGTQQILEPIYDTITPVLDKRAYYAAEKGTYRLYSIYTDNFTLCDGAELIEQPEFSSDFSGLPYKYTRINTTSGFYALYYVEPWAKWYCYDGNQWYGFDIDGNSMEVNQTVLKQALNMPVQTSIKRNRNGMPNQRLGIEEASVFMISHSNSD